VEKWNWELDEACFLPMGEVKRCRQKLQEAMEAAHGTPQIELTSEPELLRWIKNEEVPASTDVQQAETKGGNSETCYLRVLVRDPLQLEALKGLGVCEVILDYRHGVAYGPSVKKVREMGMKVCVATTRIVKPGEERRLLDLLKLLPDSVLVRNLAALQFLHHHAENLKVPLWGDFSLNICNHLSSQYFLNKGLDYWLPSYDLNLQQLESLLAVVDVGKVELTLHQTMPSFHMEHCVFATFLSEGSDISNCGMVCRKHDLALEDAKGVRHPLLADKECRNTMFNGVPQSVASLIPNFQNAGVRHFRFEALVEEGEVLREKVQGYLKVLKGQMTGNDLKARLGLKESFGVTEGQVLSDRVHIPRKKSSF
jgi:putative protease